MMKLLKNITKKFIFLLGNIEKFSKMHKIITSKMDKLNLD